MMDYVQWVRSALLAGLVISTAPAAEPVLVEVGKGWARNSVNANILRHNSLVSHEGFQYVGYYDGDGHVVLAKRALGSAKWEIRRTDLTGNARDAHNTINLMIDGAGYLHLSWDHHVHPLRYCRSVAPGSLELTDKLPMTGEKESRVTYPEFYRLPDGDLLFFYRDGASGRGDVMINHYCVRSKRWTRRQDAFIDGEGLRNAYWQVGIDARSVIHLSWVWRDTGNVATNHDMAYAKSEDGGKTWLKTNGERYELPITAANAEYAARIPQGRELINTTGICADVNGRPCIVGYWRPVGTEVPQYHLIFHDGERWHTSQIGDRKTAFSLSGGGTRRLLMSRPRVLADTHGGTNRIFMLFREVDRGDLVSIAICDDPAKPEWRFKDLTNFPVGMWEPSFDTELWEREGMLHLYVQKVGQGEGETTEDIDPTPIYVLEWKPE